MLPIRVPPPNPNSPTWLKLIWVGIIVIIGVPLAVAAILWPFALIRDGLSVVFVLLMVGGVLGFAGVIVIYVYWRVRRDAGG